MQWAWYLVQADRDNVLAGDRDRLADSPAAPAKTPMRAPGPPAKGANGRRSPVQSTGHRGHGRQRRQGGARGQGATV